jgi:hypothetical protein
MGHWSFLGALWGHAVARLLFTLFRSMFAGKARPMYCAGVQSFVVLFLSVWRRGKVKVGVLLLGRIGLLTVLAYWFRDLCVFTSEITQCMARSRVNTPNGARYRKSVHPDPIGNPGRRVGICGCRPSATYPYRDTGGPAGSKIWT